MFGNGADDVMLGGQGDDQMFGNAGNDDMVGGHNVAGGIDELQQPTATNINDLMDGGTGDDAMAGDNATVWRNGTPALANDLRLRIRTLNGALLYVAGQPNLTAGAGGLADPAGAHNDPLSATTRSVTLLDHSAAIEAADGAGAAGSRFGNDVMAGGANDDALFGQLGGDVVQGDGRIDEQTLEVQVFEGVQGGAVTDGDDYVEGNGGSDLLIGNLGQDDVIGGSSRFFGLTSATLRPDGSDVIFGGAANADRVKRHAFTGDVSGDDVVFANGIVRRHAADADFIMGDNADVYRVVTDNSGATSFVAFNYDQTSQYENRGDKRIVVRAYDWLDYSPVESVTTSIGGRDVVHGESGDDFIHGMTGDDILFGDAEDDQVFGERGKDWISGGTGDDALLGDNGFVLTSRNTLTEPLFGITAQNVTSQQYVSVQSPRMGFLQTLLNPNGELKHAVDLEPFDQGNDDVIYGGLGDDDMHGGAGNDGMSGAEALPDFYKDPENTARVEVGDIAGDRSTEIRIIPRDGNGTFNPNFYDFVNALPKLANHFLNFENDASLRTTIGSHFDANRGDGKDVIFGDWGDDWVVGGTGRDHLFGGMGNDLLNLDDNLETNGGQNDAPDNGALIPGEAGGPAQVYDNADTAYGGGGRDVLILNSGADRAEDWVGEYNSFIAPFAPFGNGQVARDVPPATFDFFYRLGESDGSDQTRTGTLTVPTGAVGDPLRKGEPYGELGLITQQDRLAPFDWATQNGAPIDNQAGNTPGGRRDTRGDGLNGGTTNTTATATPTSVTEISQAEVIDRMFAYWLSFVGVPNSTLHAGTTNDPVLDGLALNQGLDLGTDLLLGGYAWEVDPFLA
jgi:Ca2+-binding RTX toxin-like protein